MELPFSRSSEKKPENNLSTLSLFMKRLFNCAILVICLTSCVSKPPQPPLNLFQGDYSYVKDYMSWFIDKEMDEENITGLSVALVDGQKIVWQQGFGYADRENNRAAGAETIYRAGSISKIFNGIATMQFVDSSQLELDQPLSTYLPEFSINSRFGPITGITPRTILTHHSGLPENWLDGMFVMNPGPFTEVVHLINNEYVASAPNTVAAYSNLGVTLLGHVLQNIGSQDYATLLDNKLLGPMGMHNSHFAQALVGQHAAKSYMDNKEIIETPLRDIPAGGLNTTVADLARLAMLVNNRGMINNRRIISRDSLEEMFTIQNSNIPLDLGNSMGLAWFIDDKILPGDNPVYGHGGATIAHRTSFMVSPNSQLGVVVLANTGSAEPGKIARKMLRMAWEAKYLAKIPELKKSHRQNMMDPTGTYSTPMGKIAITKRSDTRYQVNSLSAEFDLRLDDNGQFYLKYRFLGFIPLSPGRLGEIGFTVEKIDQYQVIVAEDKQHLFLAGVKTTPQRIHSGWRQRCGTYTLLNPLEPEIFQFKNFTIKIEDDYLLFISTTMQGEKLARILRTVDDREAVIEGLGRREGETVWISMDSGGDEIVNYSGLRFKLDAE